MVRVVRVFIVAKITLLSKIGVVLEERDVEAWGGITHGRVMRVVFVLGGNAFLSRIGVPLTI
jgi:hypothetical protein